MATTNHMNFINFLTGGFVMLGILAIAMFAANALWTHFDNRQEKSKGGYPKSEARPHDPVD